MYIQLSFISMFISVVSCQGNVYGVVSLRSIPSEPATLFSVTENEDVGQVNVTLLLYNTSTNAPTNGSASIDEDVNIQCAITTSYSDGDTVVAFQEEVIPSFTTSGSVNFSVVQQGRAVEVQCIGQTSPDSTGTTSHFRNDTSAGPTGYVVVKKSPVVTFCEPLIIVPNSPSVTSSQVALQLSEPVVDFAVTVSCEIIGVIDANNSLWLEFEDVSVPPSDKTDIMVAYSIERLGSIVQVACYAISEEGTQYMRNTSSGEVAIFSLDTGSVTLLPAISNIKDPVFNAFLILGSVLGQNEGIVTYACYVDPITSYEQGQEIIANPTCVTPEDVFIRPTPAQPVITESVNATTSNATTPVPTTPAPTTPTTPAVTVPATQSSNVSTSSWQLQQSEIVFQEGDVYKPLVLRLNSDTPTFSGAILVSCCAPSDVNDSPKYINTSAALVFYANVEATRSINWTLATDSLQRNVETEFPNPAYVDLSPCPCDLTSGHCDTDCCCDEDCDPTDNLVYTCPAESGNAISKYDCNSSDIYRTDWSPLLCVQTSNSPYLGLYQSNVAVIRDVSNFNSIRTSSLLAMDTSYRDSGRRSLEHASPNSAAYDNGDPVELLYGSDSRGLLALPQAALSGECLWTSPVQFQEDSVTRCTVLPNQRLCRGLSPLSAMMFLRSSTETYPPCPDAPMVASRYGQSTIAPTEIRYYCLDDVSQYLSSVTYRDDLFDLYQSLLFAESESSPSDNNTVPVRCVWDDGYTQPPTPIYDNATNICFNSVLSVNYEIFWRGGEIVGVTGTVILGPVPLIPDANIVVEEEEEFVPPPPTTEPPTTTPLLTTEAGLFTEINGTMFGVTEVNGTDMSALFGQATTGGAIVPAAATPAATILAVTTPVTTTDLPTTNQTTDFATTLNITINIQNIDNATTSATESPPTTVTPFIPINTQPLNITLLYSTKFTYLPASTTVPATGAVFNTADQVRRSGNPGYVIGKPVLSGRALFEPLVFPTTPGPDVNCTVDPSNPSCVDIVINGTVLIFDRVDDSDTNQLKVFSPGDGSLCASSSAAALAFGEDTVSGCILRMGQSQLQNCTTLAAYMREQLSVLVVADRIGKLGNSSSTIETDWALIFNPDDNPYEPPTTAAPTTETPAMETTAPPLTTQFPGQAYVDPEPIAHPVDQLTSICFDVPTSVNLEVLIAGVGEYSGVTQYEILAARVTYSTSTVKLSCSGAEGSSCFLADTPVVTNSSGNGTIVQSFPVYSTVTYTTVPAQEPEPVILFYKDYDPSLCKQDTCVSELFYPFTSQFQGDPYQYSLAVALASVIITTGYFLVAWPCMHL